MLARACPHDCWSADNCDFAFFVACALQFPTKFANHGRFRFVGIDDGVDELKEIGARRRALHRNNANALMADYDFVVFSDIEKLHRSGGAFFPVNRDCTVHHRGPDFDLLPIKSNERLLVGSHIKTARENSARRRLGQLQVGAFDNFGAVLSQSQNQFVERFTGFGRDFNSRETLVRPLFADLDLPDLEIRAVGQNLIQHLGQNE